MVGATSPEAPIACSAPPDKVIDAGVTVVGMLPRLTSELIAKIPPAIVVPPV